MGEPGFGTAIIDQMRQHPDFATIPQFVCVPYGPKAPYEARKRHADTMQLYAAAGFAPFTLARDRARGEALFKVLECPSDCLGPHAPGTSDRACHRNAAHVTAAFR